MPQVKKKTLLINTFFSRKFVVEEFFPFEMPATVEIEEKEN